MNITEAVASTFKVTVHSTTKAKEIPAHSEGPKALALGAGKVVLERAGDTPRRVMECDGGRYVVTGKQFAVMFDKDGAVSTDTLPEEYLQECGCGGGGSGKIHTIPGNAIEGDKPAAMRFIESLPFQSQKYARDMLSAVMQNAPIPQRKNYAAKEEDLIAVDDKLTEFGFGPNSVYATEGEATFDDLAAWLEHGVSLKMDLAEHPDLIASFDEAVANDDLQTATDITAQLTSLAGISAEEAADMVENTTLYALQGRHTSSHGVYHNPAASGERKAPLKVKHFNPHGHATGFGSTSDRRRPVFGGKNHHLLHRAIHALFGKRNPNKPRAYQKFTAIQGFKPLHTSKFSHLKVREDEVENYNWQDPFVGTNRQQFESVREDVMQWAADNVVSKLPEHEAREMARQFDIASQKGNYAEALDAIEQFAVAAGLDEAKLDEYRRMASTTYRKMLRSRKLPKNAMRKAINKMRRQSYRTHKQLIRKRARVYYRRNKNRMREDDQVECLVTVGPQELISELADLTAEWGLEPDVFDEGNDMAGIGLPSEQSEALFAYLDGTIDHDALAEALWHGRRVLTPRHNPFQRAIRKGGSLHRTGGPKPRTYAKRSRNYPTFAGAIPFRAAGRRESVSEAEMGAMWQSLVRAAKAMKSQLGSMIEEYKGREGYTNALDLRKLTNLQGSCDDVIQYAKSEEKTEQDYADALATLEAVREQLDEMDVELPDGVAEALEECAECGGTCGQHKGPKNEDDEDDDTEPVEANAPEDDDDDDELEEPVIEGRKKGKGGRRHNDAGGKPFFKDRVGPGTTGSKSGVHPGKPFAGGHPTTGTQTAGVAEKGDDSPQDDIKGLSYNKPATIAKLKAVAQDYADDDDEPYVVLRSDDDQESFVTDKDDYDDNYADDDSYKLVATVQPSDDSDDDSDDDDSSDNEAVEELPDSMEETIGGHLLKTVKRSSSSGETMYTVHHPKTHKIVGLLTKYANTRTDTHPWKAFKYDGGGNKPHTMLGAYYGKEGRRKALGHLARHVGEDAAPNDTVSNPENQPESIVVKVPRAKAGDFRKAVEAYIDPAQLDVKIEGDTVEMTMPRAVHEKAKGAYPAEVTAA